MASESIYRMWVGGEVVDGRGDIIPVEDPSTGEIFAQCHSASLADVSDTVEAAHNSFRSGVWSRKSRHERADVLEKAAELLTKSLPELIPIEVRQTGRVIREMNAQVPSLVRWFKYYAALLRTEERSVLPTSGKLHNWIDRKPLGVVVQITPFNHPLLIAVKKLAPALAAGNSVILKPSELTPLTSLLLGRVLKEAGLPNGAFSVLPGYGPITGKALVSHPFVRKVDITGGTEAGKRIGEIVGGNLAKYTAELGGKAPVIVFEKADITAAVNGVAFGAFVASGQTCVAATRIVVENSILEKFNTSLVEKATSIMERIGDPKNPESMMGPLISSTQLTNVSKLVNEAVDSGKAHAVIGGERMHGKSPLDGFSYDNGYFYPPTILISPGTGITQNPATGDAAILSTQIWTKEAFGPVIVVVGFNDEQEAIRLANDSDFGLGAAIWTKDLSQAFRVSEEIDSGIVWINTHHRNDPSSPWGGTKGSSGVGSENGIDAYYAYSKTKSTIVNYASKEEMRADDWFREGSEDVRYG
ncbi:hypothetical protein TWF106_008988 [Orbilia oligospora]|uniref:aldehyde dehydrogenase (NAD(+)) n=1 Tax=Orbilia oligospora TaxID=2813651 RepID=A0A6G1MDY6_ORBOL|nr:hypothetical protein TWF191_010173 [Orbilia oligospora]KAF3214629.1 hypothetical protein TWF106_008988 [Orbilia oligospora]KAF3222352.1 hypothetical protein TWF679_005832 [Orbilia oligospora]KAF3253470.1 hypothetical protein TWF192_003723 [Orbilia oligospora]